MIYVTGGCSFSSSDVPNFKTWNQLTANHFYQEGNINIHTGRDAYGNDLISRSMMFSISHVRKEHPDKKIVAMVMWSGMSRKSILTDDDDDFINKNTMREVEQKYSKDNSKDILTGQNVQADGNVTEDIGYIYFTPAHAEISKPIQRYYSCTNPVNDWQNTTYDMLALQHFCESMDIDLYWCTWNNTWDRTYHDRIKGAYSVNWLYDLLNHSNRITDVGMAEWCAKFYKNWHVGDYIHPNQQSHIEFSNKVIIPFINKMTKERI